MWLDDSTSYWTTGSSDTAQHPASNKCKPVSNCDCQSSRYSSTSLSITSPHRIPCCCCCCRSHHCCCSSAVTIHWTYRLLCFFLWTELLLRRQPTLHCRRSDLPILRVNRTEVHMFIKYRFSPWSHVKLRPRIIFIVRPLCWGVRVGNYGHLVLLKGRQSQGTKCATQLIFG